MTGPRTRLPAFAVPLRPSAAVAALACALLGCQSKSSELSQEGSASAPLAPDAAAPDAARQTPQAGAGAARSYGQALSQQRAVDLAQLLRAPEAHAGKTVLVEGMVRRACSAKGCWLELATSQAAEAPGCRVTFKDYGFFVPTDSAGSTARVEGLVELTRVDKSHVDHLEGEGATFANKNEDGTATELRLVATGVELSRS